MRTQTRIVVLYLSILIGSVTQDTHLVAEEKSDAASASSTGMYLSKCAWSNDGKWFLASGNGIKAPTSLGLYDASTGKLQREFVGHEVAPIDWCFSPDGRKVFTASGDIHNARFFGPKDFTVRLWDVKSGKQLATFKRDTQSNLACPGSIQFSPNGENILALYRDKVAIVWNIKSGKQQLVLPEIHSSNLYTLHGSAIKYSPDGKRIAGVVQHQIVLWDAITGKKQWMVKGAINHPTYKFYRSFESIEFSPDGSLLLARCSDKTVRIWDVENGDEKHVLSGHKDHVSDAHFSFNGKKVMTASADGTARIWETDSGRQLQMFRHSGPIEDILLSKDSKRMIVKWAELKKDGTPKAYHATLWDVEKERIIQQFKLKGLCIIFFTPDGKRIFANLKTDLDVVSVLDANNGNLVRLFE